MEYTLTKIQIRYRDLDTVGHVNNAVYFSYFEQGRIDFIKKYLFEFRADDVNFVLARAEADFYRSIKLDDEIYVKTFISKVGKKSFDMSYEITDSSGNLYSRGKTVNVFIKNEKPIEVPEFIRHFAEI